MSMEILSSFHRCLCFVSMIRNYLPTKLDFNSWVGEMVKQKLIEDGDAAFSTGELIFWQHWMGRGYATQMEKERTRLDQCLAFTGKGGEGDSSGVGMRLASTQTYDQILS